MITLSYSSLKNIHISPHAWLNKQMGAEVPDNEYMMAGRRAHLLIQRHLLGLGELKTLTDQGMPPLLSKDKEEKWLKAEKNVYYYPDADQEFNIHSKIDFLDIQSETIYEIKTSSQPWSMGRFINSKDSLQWKLYCINLAKNYLTPRKAIFMSCTPTLRDLKIYKIDIKYDHFMIDEVRNFIEYGIDTIKNSDYFKDLVGGKVCKRYDCPYGRACKFKERG